MLSQLSRSYNSLLRSGVLAGLALALGSLPTVGTTCTSQASQQLSRAQAKEMALRRFPTISIASEFTY